MINRICSKCGIDKPTEAFGAHRKNKDGLNTECKICNNERAKAWGVLHKDRATAKATKWNQLNKQRHNVNSVKWNVKNKRKKKDMHLRRNFGISIEQYETLFLTQEGKCLICNTLESTVDKRTGEPKMLSVDHDHVTGKIRGLLCQNCNLVLGLCKDDYKILSKASAYLRNS